MSNETGLLCEARGSGVLSFGLVSIPVVSIPQSRIRAFTCTCCRKSSHIRTARKNPEAAEGLIHECTMGARLEADAARVRLVGALITYWLQSSPLINQPRQEQGLRAPEQNGPARVSDRKKKPINLN